MIKRIFFVLLILTLISLGFIWVPVVQAILGDAAIKWNYMNIFQNGSGQDDLVPMLIMLILGFSFYYCGLRWHKGSCFALGFFYFVPITLFIFLYQLEYAEANWAQILFLNLFPSGMIIVIMANYLFFTKRDSGFDDEEEDIELPASLWNKFNIIFLFLFIANMGVLFIYLRLAHPDTAASTWGVLLSLSSYLLLVLALLPWKQDFAKESGD